jgi:hypothetical protein
MYQNKVCISIKYIHYIHQLFWGTDFLQVMYRASSDPFTPSFTMTNSLLLKDS